MNKKDLPLLLMLVSGIVCCIYTFILQSSTLEKLISLFIVMLIFYLLTSIVIWVVDSFKAESEKQLKEEGEVTEEDTEGQQETESQEDAEGQEGSESQKDAHEETGEDESEESGMN